MVELFHEAEELELGIGVSVNRTMTAVEATHIHPNHRDFTIRPNAPLITKHARCCDVAT